MKIKMRKAIALMLCALMFINILTINVQAATVEDSDSSEATTSSRPMRDLDANEIVAEMGAGWNLGNTMDGHTGFTPSETAWQSVETTKALLKAVHDEGFNTVRIPVTWGTKIDDENNYKIDEAWMSRVQDIVDYAVAEDMYVIINVHHDGAEQMGWLRVATDDRDALYEKFGAVWAQIAQEFKDYDEHVVFESMNEVKGPSDSDADIKRDLEVINELNQVFVDTVRESGSNNSSRWLVIPGRYTNIGTTTNKNYGFTLPTDTVSDKLFVAVHHYDYTFGLVETMGKTTWSSKNATSIKREFDLLEEQFTSKGIPVLLGEYGAINKQNDVERAYHFEVMNRMCQNSKIVPCYWDQGWYDLSMEPDYSFTIIDRTTGECIYPELKAAMMRGLFVEGKEDLSDISKDTKITPITEINVDNTEVNLVFGDMYSVNYSTVPEKNNDVVIWKTEDAGIATVYDGNIRARGIGSTNVIGYAQSGETEVVIRVNVLPSSEKADSEIVVATNSLTVVAGKSSFINASADGMVCSYRSTNDAVATVSTIGKVVGVGIGTAYIVVTASNGETKVIPATVIGSDSTGEISLALNVYYNDSQTEYYSNECGGAITITEDGQYTLEFDCAKDLSAAATSAGVKALKNMTAVYIKDDAVTKGDTKTSPLLSCDIFYDEIVVDGVNLTVNQTEPKSAIKSSGVLDTNDPLNSWDGSYVDEVSVVDHVLNISDIENPSKIQVTFTISNLVFDEGTNDDIINVSSVTADELTIDIKGTETDDALMLNVDADKDGALVAFVSKDNSVAYVDNRVLSVEDGSVTTNIYPIGNGSTVVTAYLEDGTTLDYEISVSDVVLVADKSEVAVDDKQDVKAKIDINTIIIIISIIIVIVVGVVLVIILKK